MLKKISVIGGDLRIAKLVQILQKDNWDITTYGLEKADIPWGEYCTQAETLKEAIEKSDFVISGIPLSSDGKTIKSPFGKETISIEEVVQYLQQKTFIAGNIQQPLLEEIQKNGGRGIDILKQEELTVFNTIATAEGAIQIAMEETQKTIHGSHILVLGFGRVGKVVADRFHALGAHVACEARKPSDLAWIATYGYEPIALQHLEEHLHKYDIIINTIPSMILKEEQIRFVSKEAIIIDLASYPGGVDKEAVQEHHIRYILALALPGKVAPTTSAEYIKQTLYNVIEEKGI